MFDIDRKQQMIIIALAAVLLFTAGYSVKRWYSGLQLFPEVPATTPSRVVTPGEVERSITVHVAGAVENPGVYSFTGEKRVQDAVQAAVPLPTADIQGINLAALLKDQQKIIVPQKQEEVQPGASSGSTSSKKSTSVAPGGKVDINQATQAQLETLPGVGPALARRIISYREEKGYFSSEEEIKNVPGIGDKIYERIKDNIIVN
ncbi:MAG: helix-hairpin-helix domain-containing protein [Bacillota bacterium]